MTLSAADVRAKQFPTVRFREGYRLEDVDAFLDEVEVEMARLAAEIAELRGRLADASRVTAPGTALALLPPPAGAVVIPAPLGVPTVDPTSEAARAVLAQAQAEARSIVDTARATAAQATVDAAAQRASLEQRIEELRTFEREYRSRLRSYIAGQLSDLDASGEPATVAVTAGSSAQAAPPQPPAALRGSPAELTSPMPPVSAVPRAPVVQPPAVPVAGASGSFDSPYSVIESGEAEAPPRESP